MIEKIKNLIEKALKFNEDKIKPIVNKVIDYINDHKKGAALVSSACLIAVATIILICVYASGDGRRSREPDETGWGNGITEDIPCFSEDADSFKLTDEYAAAYYSDVKGEQVEEYVEILAEKCGVKFESDKYPRSAVLGDRIIALHYNVTEMHFSVTVTLREN